MTAPTRPRTRPGWRIGPRKMGATAALLVVAVVAAGAFAAWGDTGLLVILLAVQAATIVVMGAVWAGRERASTRRERETARQLAGRITDLEHMVDIRLTDLQRRALVNTSLQWLIERLSERLAVDTAARHAETSIAFETLRDDQRRAVDRTRADLTGRIYDAVDISDRRVQALFNLHHLLDIRDVVPLLRGFRAAPDLQAFLVSLVAAVRPTSVLELGSGASTVILGYALERAGSGKLVTLEHDPDYYEETAELVRRHGLGDRVDVRLAPLVDVDVEGETYRWYDTSTLATADRFDILVVDGPPQATGPHARYPALLQLGRHLAADATVVLDDYRRQGERETVQRWLKRYPDWQLDVVDHERGTAVLHRDVPNDEFVRLMVKERWRR